MGSVLTFFLLAGVYLALSGSLVTSNLIAAALIALGIMLLLRMGQRPERIQTLPRVLWTLLRYLGMLLADMVSSGIQVARIVLDPKLPIQPAILKIPCEEQSDLISALSAHAINLTPGELVVAIDEQGGMYTHCLDMSLSVAQRIELLRQHRAMLKTILGESSEPREAP